MKLVLFCKNMKDWLKTNYHWVIAGITLLMMFFHGGAANNFSSLHLVPLSEHLNTNRSTVALALSGKNFASFAFTFFSGFLIEKFGSRITATTGLLVAFIAYFILGSANSFPAIVIGGLLIGLTYGFCSTAAASQIVRTWFHKYAGTVLGMVTAATGIGGSAMCLIQTGMMDAFSWRASFYTAGALCGILFVISALFLRSRPRDKGLVPLGEGEEIIGRKRRISQNVIPGLTMNHLARRPAFYTMLLATFLASFSQYLIFSVVRPFLLDCGYSSGQASGTTSAMMLLLTGAKMVSGFLSDQWGAKKVGIACAIFSVISSVLLATSNSFSMAVVAIVFYSFALPLLSIVPPLMAFSLFGYRAQAQYTGIFVAMLSAAGFAGEYLTNFIHDMAGTYRVSFWLAAALAVVAIVFQLVSFRLAEKDKKLSEAQ